MHELSLCKMILDIINDQASAKKINHVKKVTLNVGQLAAVDKSALRFGFEVISKGSVAEGAILDIVVVEGQAICNACQRHVKMNNYYDACENCGQHALTITKGEELQVQSMEAI